MIGFKKKAAMQDGAAPRRHSSRRTDWLSLSLLAIATLFFAAAAFAGWQAWLVLRDQSAELRGDLARGMAVATISRQKDSIVERIDKAMKTESLASALGNDPPDLAQATVVLRGAIPELDAAEFFGTELRPLVSGDLATIGYARASLLARAQSDNKPTTILLRRFDNAPAMMQARPAADAVGNVRGYVLLRWPAQPLIDTFKEIPTKTRLELRQGDGEGDDDVIQAAGPDVPGVSRSDGKVISGTQLRIYTVPPRLPIVWPLAPITLFGIALVCLLIGAAAVWMRGAGKRALMARRAGAADAQSPENLTLRDLIESNVISGIGVRTRTSPVGDIVPRGSTADVAVDPKIFRTYDIRGVVGADLNVDVADLLGRAIGSEAVDRGITEIVVGRDGRLSGPELSAALIAGIRSTGVHVIDIGLAATPLVYFACFHLNTGSGVAVTGSHNPPNYNGFKIVLGGETLSGDAITALHQRIVEHRFREGEGGLQMIDVGPDYIERIGSDVQVQRRLKVVVDAGNGVAGAIAPQVLEEIGCEVVPLFCEVDGNFPNHHPDPSNPKNLKDLIAVVRSSHADIGVAFDGDGDRLGVVTQSGEVIYPDRLLMLFAADVLARNPGSTIIYDVKCTGKLGPEILRHGGVPMMWKTGHSLIKSKMRETGAQLAGEMSGHFFFKERWFGFDDGIYAAARLLEILANDDRPAQQVFDTLHKGVSTPELNIAMEEGETHRFVDAFKERATFDGARLTTIDGLRADWPDGWGLVRASNTTPVLVLRFDADNNTALSRIQDQFRRQLLELAPGMKLPF